MDIRKICNIDLNYCKINREERNYAAIFYAALCRPGNLERFLAYCHYDVAITADCGIYFEYSYLRDLWYHIKDENIKKEIIRQNLKIKGIDEILQLPIQEINKQFGVAGIPSVQYIQYPGKWVLVNYHKNFSDKEDFLKISKFKWAFNIKPNIVIHTDKNTAICIEAKFESGEGHYPSSGREKEIFNELELTYVGQMELQKYMMEKLLGITTEFLFLTAKKEKSSTHKVINWTEAFGCLDIAEMPGFAVEMVRNVT